MGGAKQITIVKQRKWPIQCATKKLTEAKRKAINTIIVVIPMMLSLLLNVLYYGIVKHIWLQPIVLQSVATCYLAATVIYAVWARLIIVFKGFKKDSATDLIAEQTAASQVKNVVAGATQNNKVRLEALKDVGSQINKLIEARNQIVNNIALKDVANLDQIDNKLQKLNQQKQQLETGLKN